MRMDKLEVGCCSWQQLKKGKEKEMKGERKFSINGMVREDENLWKEGIACCSVWQRMVQWSSVYSNKKIYTFNRNLLEHEFQCTTDNF